MVRSGAVVAEADRGPRAHEDGARGADAGRDTDVPLTYVCRQIERDLREQLGEADLPAPVVAVDGYLW